MRNKKQEPKLNIEITTKDGYKDSFWFEDITVATKGDYVLIPCGEVQVMTPEGDILNQYEAIEYAEDHNWKDKDLDKFEFLMNNWFEIQKDLGNTFEPLDIISYDYDEAINELKNIK